MQISKQKEFKLKKHIAFAYLLIVFLHLNFIPSNAQQYLNLPIPSREQLVFQEAELGVVFHYDLNVFDGKKKTSKNRITPIPDINIFNPEQLDTDQWIRTAKSTGRNSTLILGLTPNSQGLMPETDVKRLKEFGAEIQRRFSKPIMTTNGNKKKLSLNLKKKTKINHIIIKEEISKGERIRKFVVEVFKKGKWQEIARGECIGHKRIQKIKTVSFSRIRIRVLKSRGIPQLKNLVFIT